MKKVWLLLFRLEILLVGIFLCEKALITFSVGTDYSVHWQMTMYPSPLLVTGGSLLMIGIVILSIPKVKSFLTKNSISAYLIPMHFWVLLVLIVMELTLRLTVFSEPFGIVYTNWFDWVAAKGSYYLWSKEGFGVTRFDGPPGEIHTPFQGGENIVVLGDSFTEGLQVPDSQKFASVAEAALRQDGYYFDLHNFGHSGLAVADYVSTIYGYQVLYHPRAIVIQLDYTDFIESFSPIRNNYFVVQNSKIVDIQHRNKIEGDYVIGDVLLNNFRLMLWTEYGKSRFNQMTEKPVAAAEDSSIPTEFDANLASQQMDLLLKAADGTPLILIAFPHAPYVSGNQIVMDAPKHEQLKTFLASYSQVTVVDPLPAFQDLVSAGFFPMGFSNSPTPGWGHLNRRGNEALGRLLAKAIEEVLK